MPREALKQRIAYLIEHGGAYPEDRRRDWKSWVMLGMLAFVVIVELLKLLR